MDYNFHNFCTNLFESVIKSERRKSVRFSKKIEKQSVFLKVKKKKKFNFLIMMYINQFKIIFTLRR